MADAPTPPAPAGAPALRPTLAGALLEAQRAIAHVEHDAQNKHHNYGYVSAEGMIAVAREVLHRFDLVVSVLSHRIVNSEKPDALLVLRTTLQVDHAASGERRLYRHELPIHPDKGRPPDKAALGCESTVLGYFYRDLLQLPRVERGAAQVEQRDDRRWQPRDGDRPQEQRRDERLIPMGESDAAGLMEQIRNRSQAGCTLADLRQHLQQIRVYGPDPMRANLPTWPKVWKKPIRAWLAEFPEDPKASASPAAQPAGPTLVPAGSAADPANPSSRTTKPKPGPAGAASRVLTGQDAHIGPDDIPF